MTDMNRKNKIVISSIVLAALIGYLTFTGLGNTISRYIEIDELKSGAYEGQIVSVNGTVVKDTLMWDPGKMELTFKLGDHSGIVDVYYRGNLPNSMREEIPVVVQGKYSDGLLTARNILVKCPSKYEAEIEQ